MCGRDALRGASNIDRERKRVCEFEINGRGIRKYLKYAQITVLWGAADSNACPFFRLSRMRERENVLAAWRNYRMEMSFLKYFRRRYQWDCGRRGDSSRLNFKCSRDILQHKQFSGKIRLKLVLLCGTVHVDANMKILDESSERNILECFTY